MSMVTVPSEPPTMSLKRKTVSVHCQREQTLMGILLRSHLAVARALDGCRFSATQEVVGHQPAIRPTKESKSLPVGLIVVDEFFTL